MTIERRHLWRADFKNVVRLAMALGIDLSKCVGEDYRRRTINMVAQYTR